MEASKETDYKSKYAEVLQQKERLEHEFGLKRAKFKSMFLECESKLKDEVSRREDAESRVVILEAEVKSLTSNIEGIQIAAKLSEEARQEELAAIKVKHVEEVTSMEHIWREAVREARATTARHFDEEHKKLVAANQKLEQQLKSKSEDKSEGIMSMVSQAMKRGPSTSPTTQDPKAESKVNDELSDTMKQAQESVEAWRSIVMPLEQEIASLKTKLKDAAARLKQYEAKATRSSTEEMSPEALSIKLQEVQGYLDAERSSRTDLEMFVAVLNTQKGVLQEDADKLRQELHNVCRLLEQEKSEHRELKETWKKANEQFIEQQTTLCWEIEKMREMLSPAQNERLSKEYRQRDTRPAHAIKTHTEDPYVIRNSADDLIKFDSSPKKSSSKPATPSDVQLIEPIPSRSPSSPDSMGYASDHSSSKVQSERVISLEEGEELEEDVDGMKYEKENMIKKSASSSDISSEQGMRVPSPVGKSLSHGDVSSVVVSSGDDAWAVISSPTAAELDKKLQLNETGWSTMKESSLTNATCMMCQNYEKQLQRLQREFIDLKDKKDALLTFAKKEKLELRSEREKVEKLEKSICEASEDAQKQICLHAEKEKEHEAVLEQLQTEFLSMKEEVRLNVMQLSEDRDRMMAEFESLREENMNLTAIQDTLTSDQEASRESKNNTDIEALQQKIEQLQLNASLNEKQLQSEVMFLKDRVVAEEYDKENTEKILQSDLDQARQEIAKLKEELAIRDTGRRREDDGNRIEAPLT